MLLNYIFILFKSIYYKLLILLNMYKRQQTETTYNQDDTNLVNQQIITKQKDRTLLNPQERTKIIYDGFDLIPNYKIGITSQEIHISDDQQITYISGNNYCIINNLSSKRMECLDRRSENGILKKLFVAKNKKYHLIGSSQLVVKSQQKYANINVYDKITNINKKIVIPTLGNIKDIFLFLDDKLGMILFDQSPDFVINLYDYDKQIIIQRHERKNKAIKIVSSNFGDFNLVLCQNSIFEIELDSHHRKIQLSQFEIKRYLVGNEICVDANFIKNTIKLVIITTKKILLFEGPVLVSKIEIQFPIVNIIPFQQQRLNLNISPIQKTIYTNLIPKKIQTSDLEVFIQFQNFKQIGIWKLNDKTMTFEGSYHFDSQDFKDKQIKKYFYINGQLITLLNNKNKLQIWKMIKRYHGEQYYQTCSIISHFSYLNQPGFIASDMSIANKLLATIHYDKTFRLWNFEEEMIYQKSFFETPLNLTFHPFGHTLAIIFKEFTRFYLVQQYNIQFYYTLKIKNITAIKYSSTGNLLVIIEGQNIHVLNAYSYITLMIFSTNLSNIIEIKIKNNQICIRNEQNLAIYDIITKKKIIQRKGKTFQFGDNNLVYYQDKNTLKLISYEDENIKEFDIVLKKMNENQKITCIKIYIKLGIILIGTSEGNLFELLWPIYPTSDNDYEFYKFKIGNTQIIFMQIQETYQNLVVVTADSLISNIKLVQYIDGIMTNGRYIFKEKNQDAEKNEKIERRVFLAREYLFDKYLTTSLQKYEQKLEEVNEAEFFRSNKNVQIIQSKQKNIMNIKQYLEDFTKKKQLEIQLQKKEIESLRNNYQISLQKCEKQLLKQKLLFEENKQKQVQKFEKYLLQIIKKSDGLTKIRDQQSNRLKNIISSLQEKNHDIISQFKKQKNQNFAQLLGKFNKLAHQVKQDGLKMNLINEEIQNEQKNFREMMHIQIEQQFNFQQDRRYDLNLKFSKHQKQIKNLQVRKIHLENLILETSKQIKQLEYDQQEYNLRINQLKKQLGVKEGLINMKENELKKIFGQNKNIKNFKQIHEYLLQEFQKQYKPNEERAIYIQGKVKVMNQQLLQQIQWRHKAEKKLEQAMSKLQQLKQIKKKKQIKKFDSRNSIQLLKNNLKNMMNIYVPEKWKQVLRKVLGDFNTRHSGQINLEIQYQQAMQLKNQIKNMIINKQLINDHINRINYSIKYSQKSQAITFKKYQIENNELVNQYNLLVKQKNSLEQKLTILRQSLQLFKEHTQFNKIQQSPQVVTTKRQLKMTPFQKYVKQQQLSTKLHKDKSIKSILRLPPLYNSEIWVKNVIRDANETSPFDTYQLLRSRVKTFINPQINIPIRNSKKNNFQEKNKKIQQELSKINLQKREFRTKSQAVIKKISHFK